MASSRIPIIVGDRVRAFLDAERRRTDRTLSDIIRSIMVDSSEFKAWDKLSREPVVEPKTTTTVVADNPNPVFIANLCFHGVNLDHHRCLDCAAANREPTLQETMAELDRVSSADIPLEPSRQQTPDEMVDTINQILGEDQEPK